MANQSDRQNTRLAAASHEEDTLLPKAECQAINEKLSALLKGEEGGMPGPTVKLAEMAARMAERHATL
jgi:hypothetical protein